MPAAVSIKTLIVDDQQTMRSLIRTSLHALGITQTREAPDGEEALRSLLSGPCNLVITDFNMPKLDGLGLLRAIRAHAPTSKTAVIMLTGRADRELVQRAVQFGVNNYLVKPFTTQTLKEKIEAVFGPLT
jgi:two-component system chemotaxis response regulator CheY